jgi:phosphoribosyl-ATP pyrophosphohydrolase
MIIPSIDLMNGQAVQLIGGREHALDAGDPMPIAERFALAGDVAVVDLDAALGRGDNRSAIEALCRRYPCRVGGGIRSEHAAKRWLDAGARRIVIGTAAAPELLCRLPRERVVAALDAVDGEVVVDGWRAKTGANVLDRMRELSGLVAGFLVTFVEREGRMQGIDRDRAAQLRRAAGDAELVVAGGVTTAADVADLDRLGIDAQVGMALYTDTLDLADAIAAPLTSDRPDGLWPTVVVDVHGRALGQCYSNAESLREAVRSRRGVYWSRSRGLWIKGETSGATQRLLNVTLDCDRDTLRFTVDQQGSGFCHQASASCWGDLGGLPAIAARIAARTASAPPGSYTRRLLDDPTLLAGKLREEAQELAEAETNADVAWEAADVLYFTLVAMARAGVSLADVEAELQRRSLVVNRRSEGEIR